MTTAKAPHKCDENNNRSGRKSTLFWPIGRKTIETRWTRGNQHEKYITSQAITQTHTPNVCVCDLRSDTKEQHIKWLEVTKTQHFSHIRIVIIFVHHSRILQSTVFSVSIRCKALPTVRAHI